MLRAFDPLTTLGLIAAAAASTALLIVALHPWLVRYALARPNARSSHSTPTPQGGGIAVVIVVAAVLLACRHLDIEGFRAPWVTGLLFAMSALAVMGAIDDINPLPVWPRLFLHFAVASLLVATLPVEGRIIGLLPPFLETALLVIGLVWFTNLTNFMDGIDWMTVVEVVPIAACLAIIGYLGVVPALATPLPVILALLGAMIGFAPFNRHVARLFLGDVGSLPIGALLGWVLIILALAGHAVAALILPLYYLADATITLFRRFRNGERISQAHRSHFYQRAVTGGYTVPQVTQAVLVLNVVLAALAGASIALPRPAHQVVCLGAALAATLYVLLRFNRGVGR